MWENIQILEAGKMAIVMLLLAGASVMDLRYRRIPDRFWLVMALASAPIVIWEMLRLGADDSPITLLSLLMPAAGILFIIFGYPELKEITKGSKQDLMFAGSYTAAVAGGIIAFSLGDRVLFSKVALSMLFILIYFILYSVPIAGARIIHGGADAKCLITLAALFPWYVEDMSLSQGPFYELLYDVPSLGTIFPFHLSVLFNAAVITGLVLLVLMPLRNLTSGSLDVLRMFSSYEMDVNKLEGAHVWVIRKNEDGKRKVDPEPEVIRELKDEGLDRVRVTPKLPFILSLTMGFIIQVFLGNLVIAVFLYFN